MRLFEQYLTAAFLLVASPSIAQHSYPPPVDNVDDAWKKLESITRDAVNYKKNDFASAQARYLKYREEGLKFWKMFPNDSRRYQWLFMTVERFGGFTLYWKFSDYSYKSILHYNSIREAYQFPKKSYSWPINKVLLRQWEKIYPQLKKEYLSYYAKNPQLNTRGDLFSTYELDLFGGELWSFLQLSLNKEYGKSNKIDLDKLKSILIESGKYLNKQNINIPNQAQGCIFTPLDNYFIARYQEYGLTANDMKSFFGSIKNSSYPILRDWALQRSSLFELMKTPFTLKHTSIKGDTVDLFKLRGKVVLVDFWSTACTSCIERMPAIKAIYDKYKGQGFEVISACLNYGDETKRIKEIEKKIGADWPTILIGGNTKEDRPNSLGQQIFLKYGFWGVPQLLLLDKSGKLVMLNDKLRNRDFEPDVKRLLAESYKVNK